MASVVVEIASPREHSGLPSGFFEPCWYATYTCANHEKRVAEQLAQRAVERLPTALPDGHVEIMRAGLAGQLCAEPHPFLTLGRREWKSRWRKNLQWPRNYLAQREAALSEQ